jgi:zinc protease
LNLLAELLTEAAFPLEEVERQKQSILAQMKANEESPGWIAEKKLHEILFPHNAYGRPVEGRPESLPGIERADLISFYQSHYRPDRAILAAVGDISHQEIAGKLDEALRSWKAGGTPTTLPSIPPPAPATLVKIPKDLTQANILMGHRGVPRTHPDYYAIQIMNYILGGGGFSSRLMESVRNQRGLAYSVYSAFDAQKYAGTFQIAMQTRNETADEAVQIAREEVRRMRDQKVSPEEIQAAKDYLIGSFPLRFDTNRRVADLLAYAEFFELGLDYVDRYPELIRRVGADEVARAAQAYLQPDGMVLVVVSGESRKEGAK